jgi:LCP family protein required for cell wall assembly
LQSRSSGPSPIIAATLSFILPGLGQMYAGATWRGVLWAIPQVAVLGFGVGLLVSEDLYGLAGTLFLNARPIAIVLLVMLVYRVLAVIDAYVRARGRRSERSGAPALPIGAAVLALLVVANVVPLGYAAASAWGAAELGTNLTDCSLQQRGRTPDPRCMTAASPTAEVITPPPSGAGSEEPTEEPTPTEPEETLPPTPPGQTPTPEPTPIETGTPPPTPQAGARYWAENWRFDVLLIGGDAGPGRTGIRTDTMIVLSVDVASSKAALFGVPRNLYNVPLPDESKEAFPQCGCFPGRMISGGSNRNLLNALYKYAMDHPRRFPGGEGAGFRALSGSIEKLLNVQLDGIAYINLNGFVKVIDALGGVTVDVPPPGISDNRYPREDGKGTIRLRIPPGTQKMDGTTALRFARSRHQDSDYGRMKRQQTVLTAVRRELNVCSILPRIPALLDATKGAFLTDIPPEELPELLRLVGRVELGSIRRHYFTPGRGFDSHLDRGTITKIRNTVVTGFDKGGEVERSGGSSGPGGIC